MRDKPLANQRNSIDTVADVDRQTKNVIPFSPMKPKIFRFVTEPYIREHHHQLSRAQFERLRGILPRGIYWSQPTGRGGAILWNLPLFLTALAMGADSPRTTALVDEYMATIPKTA
jgi:hypothetical protein